MVKIGKYTLHSNEIFKMKRSIEESDENNVEIGYSLCTDSNNNIKSRNICRGAECKVTQIIQCRKDETYLGTFHTHPRESSIKFSGTDVMNAYTDGFSCIGSAKVISCYTRKGNLDTNIVNRISEIRRIEKQLDEEKRKIVNDNFAIVDIK